MSIVAQTSWWGILYPRMGQDLSTIVSQHHYTKTHIVHYIYTYTHMLQQHIVIPVGNPCNMSSLALSGK